MARRDRSNFVGFRIPEGLLMKIDRDVEESAEFSSRSDYILCAIRSFMAQREKSVNDSGLKHLNSGEVSEEDFLRD